MTSLYQLKPRFQQVLRPYADQLASRGIAPNHVTLAALLLSCLGGLLVVLFPDASGPLVILGLIQPVRMALNAIDGMIARAHAQETANGRLLNEIADVASDMVLYLPLVLVPEFSPFLVALAVIMAVLTEVAGLAAVSVGASRRHDGPMGKSDRALAIGALALLAGLGILPAVLINLALCLIVGLAFLTVIHRVNGALEEHAVREEEKSNPPKPPIRPPPAS